MKIKRIKFYQSIKCNSELRNSKSEYVYMDTELEPYTVTYESGMVKIVNLDSKEITYTGMNNVVYFTTYDKK